MILQVGRLENAIGWYHSHPGYGCWLSGIDVSTQMLNQQFQEPFVAVVVRLFELIILFVVVVVLQNEYLLVRFVIAKTIACFDFICSHLLYLRSIWYAAAVCCGHHVIKCMFSTN